MFVSSGLLYLHIPRTGGTFVTSLLERAGLGARQISSEVGGHDGIRSVPSSIVDKSFVFATVRDPWSWYFSVDSHYRQKSSLDGFLLEMFGTKKPSSRESISAMIRPSSYASLRRDGSIRLPGGRRPIPRVLEAVEDSGVGLYTFMILNMLCQDDVESIPDVVSQLEAGAAVPWSVDAVIDTRQIRQGLDRVLRVWRPDVAESLRDQISSEKPRNEKGRFRGCLSDGCHPDENLYDAPMIDEVLARDGAMMRLLGFDHQLGSPFRPPVRVLRS